MHNGVGLRTPRGSGTNGYVQKSLASLPVNKIVKLTHQSDSITRPKSRTDPEILIHEKKREIELKLMELKDTLKSSMSNEEIENEIKKQRIYMINNLSSIPLDLNRNEHIMADVKNKQMNKLQRVLKISTNGNGIKDKDKLEANKNKKLVYSDDRLERKDKYSENYSLFSDRSVSRTSSRSNNFDKDRDLKDSRNRVKDNMFGRNKRDKSSSLRSYSRSRSDSSDSLGSNIMSRSSVSSYSRSSTKNNKHKGGSLSNKNRRNRNSRSRSRGSRRYGSESSSSSYENKRRVLNKNLRHKYSKYRSYIRSTSSVSSYSRSSTKNNKHKRR